MKRRDFLQTSMALGLSAAGASALADGGGELRVPHRRYGRTAEMLSVIGLGGIVVADTGQAEADRLVAGAIEYGVNYFDVAPSYGNAQDRLGPALEPWRKHVFLACKTARRDAAGAREELAQSLRVLRTDHFDLYQLHGLATMEDLDACFAKGGAMEVVLDAKERGLTRYVGFSAHSVEVALEAMRRYDFASVLFPLNCVCIERGGFGPSVLAEAKRRGMGILALKAMAWTPWPEGAERAYPKCWYRPIDELTLARLALNYTLDLGVTAAIPPGDARFFGIALAAALHLTPLHASDRAELLKAMEGVAPIFSHA